MIKEKRVLASVELLFCSRTVQVKWLDQVVKDGEVIKETPHRRAYMAAEIPEGSDQFSAEAIIRGTVEQFAERLAAETEARQKLEADLVAAAQSVQAGTALLEQTGAMLRTRDDELTNVKAVLAKREQELKESRIESLQNATSRMTLRERIAQLRDELAALKTPST